jgi:hypothetical protein
MTKDEVCTQATDSASVDIVNRVVEEVVVAKEEFCLVGLQQYLQIQIMIRQNLKAIKCR